MEEQDDSLKESLSNMFKNGGTEDAKLAAGIITANPDLIPLKDIWYNINDLITKDTTRYVELYCREGAHDKVYIIIENRIKYNYNSSKYNVIAYYGRRGKNLVKKDYGISHWSGQLDELKSQKLTKKGYTIVNEYDRNISKTW